MATWNEFVKKIREERNITYKEALKVASPLWKAEKEKQKLPKKKTKRKIQKKKITIEPDVSEFPVQKKKTKTTKQKIAKTTTQKLTDVGGSLKKINARNDYLAEGSRRRNRKVRFKQKTGIQLDSQHKYVARISKI